MNEEETKEAKLQRLEESQPKVKAELEHALKKTRVPKNVRDKILQNFDLRTKEVRKQIERGEI